MRCIVEQAHHLKRSSRIEVTVEARGIDAPSSQVQPVQEMAVTAIGLADVWACSLSRYRFGQGRQKTGMKQKAAPRATA